MAPLSTEVKRVWGSAGTTRGTTSTTDGVANTTTLYGFGSVAHPAAYYVKALTTGGYNTWYLPAKDELNTLYSNKVAVPFATADSFGNIIYYSSTERNGSYCWGQNMGNGTQYGSYAGDKSTNYTLRATRRSMV